jgi:long-subunit fatty acid transport protein
MIKHTIRLASLAATVLFGLATAHQASAAGYEKSIMWGGRSAGLAGIAAPWITGSQSLYFNPAGLVKEKAGQDVNFAISPTVDEFTGPINNDATPETSSRDLSTPIGLTYGNSGERFGYGVGYFVSGGSKATYNNVDFGSLGNEADVYTDLRIQELSGGLAYKVNDRLKIGAALRIVMAHANLAFVQRAAGGAILINARLQNMEDTYEPGYRLGAQYKLSDDTTLGFNYRSSVELTATGQIDGDITGAAPGHIKAAPATADTVFPQQAVLGVDHAFSDVWRGMLEGTWTQYSQVDKVRIKTSTTSSVGAIGNQEIVQNWKDQLGLHLAGEYTGCHMPIRFGYGYTSQVTNTDFARAAFTAPGPAHTLTLGSGHSFEVSGKPVNLDFSYEYTAVKGSGTGAAAGSATGDIREGDYTTTAHAIHLAADYAF